MKHNAVLAGAGHETSGNGVPYHRVGLEREVRTLLIIDALYTTIALTKTLFFTFRELCPGELSAPAVRIELARSFRAGL